MSAKDMDNFVQDWPSQDIGKDRFVFFKALISPNLSGNLKILENNLIVFFCYL
jgi:hypothetical protein